MRDPDLVQRAERAAMALERAWGHWRVMHGLGSDPLPPVSSYVGYSLEEPWGQPRVVFGVGAEEAEQLAALLAGHDCYGPVHAEVSARPDWRLAASAGLSTGPGRPFDGGVSVPAQAPPPGAEPAAERDAWHVTAAADAGEVDGGPASVRRYEADPTAMDSAVARSYRPDQDEAEPPRIPASPIRAEPASMLPTAAAAGPDALDPLPADPHEPAWRSGVQEGGDRGQGQPEPGRPYSGQRRAAGRTGSIPPPAEFWQLGEPAGTVELAAVEQSSVIAFRRRSEQPADQWLEEIPAAPPASDRHEAVPSQGPGYCGPRYQGFPPKYQPGPGQHDPPALFGAGTEGAGTEGAGTEDAGEPSGAVQPEAVPSGSVQAEAVPSGTGEREAEPSGTGEPEAVPSGAVQPEAVPSGTGEPEVKPAGAGQPDAVQSGAEQPGAEQPAAEQPAASGPSASAPSAARPKAGQSGVRRSTSGQSKTGQSRTRQSRTVQSPTAQSGGPAKGAQPRTVQSKAGPSKQTSPASSPGRSSGSEAGKRPRG
jgi:hypothetical protein